MTIGKSGGWLAVLLLVSCGGAPSQFLPGFNPPPPPAGGFQIVTPIWHGIPAGGDAEVCTWTNYVTQKDENLVHFNAYESLGGHHVILYVSNVRQPPMTRLCKDTDMVNFRMVGGSGPTGKGYFDGVIPPGVVFRIPAGSQLVVNHHYINSTDAPIDGQAALNIVLGDPSPSDIPAGSLAFNDSDFSIPAGATTYSHTTHCTVGAETKAWLLLPHEHEYGQRFTMTLTHAGTTTTLLDQPWNPEYSFDPPLTLYSLSNLVDMKPGDDVAVTCTWSNGTAQSIAFPKEMCVAFGLTLDPGDILCDNGTWGTL